MANGLCQCGCGQPTQAAPQTKRSRGWVKGQPMRFLPNHGAKVVARRGEESHRWRGGRVVEHGYVLVYQPTHHRARMNGYVPEHILIVEDALGHPLPPRAEVHHVNEQRADNRRRNFVACEDLAYHKLLHRRLRALRACGDASARRCGICSRYDRQDEITITTKDRPYHRSCATDKARKRHAHR